MTRSKGFVCAFRGRRDDYQVPLALAEEGRLEAFITDIYQGPSLACLAAALPRGVADKIARRAKAGLEGSRIHCLLSASMREQFRKWAGMPAAEIYAAFDREYSLAAAKYARKRKADLFLYSPYAWDAFSARYEHRPKKILFQYHPHIQVEHDVLSRDLHRFHNLFPQGLELEGPNNIGNAARLRGDESWKYADHIVCASTYTRETLIAAGADQAKISVVPYGVDRTESTEHARDEGFHVLFVGSGVQRKGLHHLLLAWKRARLPAESKLTLVCRVIEPALLATAEADSRIQLFRGATPARLEQLYRSATLFAMPSLIEGFGQVYLEALSFGLPVLGTAHTALPDIGSEADGVYLCEAGSVEALAETLERLSAILPGSRAINARARDCSRRFTWQRFRQNIRALL